MSDSKNGKLKKFKFGLSEGIIVALIGLFAVVFNAVWNDFQENRGRKKAEISNFADKTVLNQHERDFGLISLVNVTRHGNSKPDKPHMEWKYAETANAGDEVAISIYYHNNGPEPAYQLKAKLTLSNCNGELYCRAICANLDAKNSTQSVTGCAKLYIEEGSYTLPLSYTVWNVAQATQGRHLLPHGQTGAEIWTKRGLLLGDICEGWNCQGNIVTKLAVVSLPNTAEPFRGERELTLDELASDRR